MSDRPTSAEGHARQRRMDAAQSSALAELREYRRDPECFLDIIRAHPACSGGRGIVGDLGQELTRSTRRFPGLGPSETHWMVPSVVLQAREAANLLVEAARLRLAMAESPREPIHLVIGPAAAGKTTHVEALLRDGRCPLVMEMAGCITQILLHYARTLKAMGYPMHLVAVYAPLEACVDRATHRTFTLHRPVMAQAAARSHLDFMANFPRLVGDADPVWDAVTLRLNPEWPTAPTECALTDPSQLQGLNEDWDAVLRESPGLLGLEGPTHGLDMLEARAAVATLDALEARSGREEPDAPDLLWAFGEALDQALPGSLIADRAWMLWRQGLAGGRGA